MKKYELIEREEISLLEEKQYVVYAEDIKAAKNLILERKVLPVKSFYLEDTIARGEFNEIVEKNSGIVVHTELFETNLLDYLEVTGEIKGIPVSPCRICSIWSTNISEDNLCNYCKEHNELLSIQIKELELKIDERKSRLL